jgi:hypothetical protein
MTFRTSAIAAAIAVSGSMLTLPAGAAPSFSPLPTYAQGEVTYLSGGVGESETSAIRRDAKNYPLELEFVMKATPRNEYLSGVKVDIRDAHRKLVLETTSDGPFMLADMPAGKYTVSAENQGKTEIRHVQIAAGEHQRVIFEWTS